MNAFGGWGASERYGGDVDALRYRDQVEVRKCKSCHSPLPARWSPELCGSCMSGPFWHWMRAEERRVRTFEAMDLFHGVQHHFDMREVRNG
jgi:hypothetical protein